MKNILQIFGITVIFLAMLVPQISYGQTKLKIGDPYKGGIIFSMNKTSTSAIICQKKDLGKTDWDKALAACKKLGNGWRLPTKGELNLMYKNLHKKRKGAFKNGYYWSGSDKNDEDLVWDQDFGDGETNFGDKRGIKEYIRAVKKVSIKKKKLTNKTKNTTGGIKIGDKYKGGFVFKVNSDAKAGLICKTRDLAQRMEVNEAVAACKKLGNGWRLPTKDELNLMYKNLHKKGRGNFIITDGYWTSTPKDIHNTWWQEFSTGRQAYDDKDFEAEIRPVKEVRFSTKETSSTTKKGKSPSIQLSQNGKSIQIKSQVPLRYLAYYTKEGFRKKYDFYDQNITIKTKTISIAKIKGKHAHITIFAIDENGEVASKIIPLKNGAKPVRSTLTGGRRKDGNYEIKAPARLMYMANYTKEGYWGIDSYSFQEEELGTNIGSLNSGKYPFITVAAIDAAGNVFAKKVKLK